MEVKGYSKCVRRAIAGVLPLAAVCTSSLAFADNNVMITGDRANTGPNPYLLTSGLTTLGVSYTPAAVVAVNSPRAADRLLFAPVIGPWLDLAARDCDGCDGEKRNRTLLVVDGIVQAIGAAQIAASMMFINTGGDTASASDTPVVVPARLATGHYGLLASGHF